MSGKPLLDMTPFVQVQMKINGGGLDVVMAQVVLNVRNVMAAIEHIHCPAVTKAVHRIDMLEPLGRKGLLEILFADTVNTMSGELFSPLIDK